MGNVVEGVSQYSGDGALCWPEEGSAEALSITDPHLIIANITSFQPTSNMKYLAYTYTNFIKN